MKDYSALLQRVKENPASLFQKDFLLTWDKTLEELNLVLDVAEVLKFRYQNKLDSRVFHTGKMGM